MYAAGEPSQSTVILTVHSQGTKMTAGGAGGKPQEATQTMHYPAAPLGAAVWSILLPEILASPTSSPTQEAYI